jgi:hypothetical protein
VFGVSRRQEFQLFEIATGDFPNQLGPLIGEGARGTRSGGVETRDFARAVTLCIRNREFPNRYFPIARRGDNCQGIGLTRGVDRWHRRIEGSGFCDTRELRPVKSRFRDPRSHERRKRTWQSGSTRHSGRQVASVRSSGFGN